MKKFIILITILLFFSVSLTTITGCAKKKAEPEKEQIEEAPEDTTETAIEDTTNTE